MKNLATLFLVLLVSLIAAPVLAQDVNVCITAPHDSLPGSFPDPTAYPCARNRSLSVQAASSLPQSFAGDFSFVGIRDLPLLARFPGTEQTGGDACGHWADVLIDGARYPDTVGAVMAGGAFGACECFQEDITSTVDCGGSVCTKRIECSQPDRNIQGLQLEYNPSAYLCGIFFHQQPTIPVGGDHRTIVFEKSGPMVWNAGGTCIRDPFEETTEPDESWIKYGWLNTGFGTRFDDADQGDVDDDGIDNDVDVCAYEADGPNATEPTVNQLGHECDDQQDGDGDGFGNACDSNFNNNAATDPADTGLLLNCLMGFCGSTPDEYDLNCNGAADLVDIGQTFTDAQDVRVPGPSCPGGDC